MHGVYGKAYDAAHYKLWKKIFEFFTCEQKLKNSCNEYTTYEMIYVKAFSTIYSLITKMDGENIGRKMWSSKSI